MSSCTSSSSSSSTSSSRYWSTVLCDASNNNDDIRSPQLSLRKTIAKSKTARQFPCNRCNARFERRGHLQSHIDTVHDRLRPYSCPRRACGKVFGHRSSLARHLRTAHGRSLATSPPALGIIPVAQPPSFGLLNYARNKHQPDYPYRNLYSI